jgi:hypothetical protein
VANREYHDLFPVVMIQSDVDSMSEFNQPLPELWCRFFDWAADLGVLA